MTVIVRRARAAALAAVEAAYAPARDERAWLDGILVALDGLNVGEWLGYTVDGTAIRTISERCGEYAAPIAHTNQLPRHLHLALHVPSPPVVLARQQIARVLARASSHVADMERLAGPVPQLTGVLGFDARARGAFLGLRGEHVFAPRTKRTLAHVGAHVAAAYRLRAHAQQTTDDADAVCAPDGRMLHGSRAALTARESLAISVKRLDEARGQLRRLDPEESVARWTAMVEGRWSLVEHVESDGKRLILAHRNDAPSNVAALRGHEARVATLAALGHADKYIAYELGLRRTTVSTHLRAALVKLRLPDRRALVRAFGPLARSG